MKVEMCARISGTRNGVDWPGIGETIELPDDEAVAMIGSGLARAVAAPVVETATVPAGETADAPKAKRSR